MTHPNYNKFVKKGGEKFSSPYFKDGREGKKDDSKHKKEGEDMKAAVSASAKRFSPLNKEPKEFRLMERIKRNKPVYAMIAPSVIILIVFSIYPILWALGYVFFEYNGMSDAKFVGLDNFIRILTRDPDYWNSVINTFEYAVGKLLMTLPVSFILAVILNKSIKGRGFFRTAIFMPTIISAAVMSLVFYFIFNSYNGIVNQLLMRFGLVERPIEWLGRNHAMLTAIIVAAWGAIGNYMIYFLAGLQSIPEELYESASIDGANKFQELFFITIPMMGPVLQVVFMLAIIVSLKGFESIMVLTAGGPAGATDVMYLYIYRAFFPMASDGGAGFTAQYGYGSAVAIVTASIVGVITLLYLYISKKMNETF